MTKLDTTDWQWWAGRDEEYLTVGPHATRDDAIAEALCDIGVGEGCFHVMEGRMHILTMSADGMLDRFIDGICDDSDLYSTEHDAPEWQATPDQQKQATAEMQAFMDVWMDQWRHTFTAPNMFADTRNREVIANTVDPDMLPGGHDNPRDAA